MTPKVSVCIITYNHERYIAKAIESALAQRCDFPFEIVVGEDCSTDGTRAILRDFEKKHPGTIRVVTREKNAGPRQNFIDAYAACRGDYIAFFDGDDYWSDPHKIQKQADFLDDHPECALCFTAAKTFYENADKPGRVMGPTDGRTIYALDDILQQNPFCTGTTFFRNRLWDTFPDWYGYSWTLYVLCAQYGKIGYIPDETTMYRMHEGGIHSTKDLIHKYELSIHVRELVLPDLSPHHQRVARSAIFSYNWRLLRIAWKRKMGEETRKYARRCLSLIEYSHKKFVDRVVFAYFLAYTPGIDRFVYPLVRGVKNVLRLP